MLCGWWKAVIYLNCFSQISKSRQAVKQSIPIYIDDMRPCETGIFLLPTFHFLKVAQSFYNIQYPLIYLWALRNIQTLACFSSVPGIYHCQHLSEIFVSIDAHVTLVRRRPFSSNAKICTWIDISLQSHAYSYHVSERETKNVDIRDKIKHKGSVSLFDSEARYTNIYCQLIGKNQTWQPPVLLLHVTIVSFCFIRRFEIPTHY